MPAPSRIERPMRWRRDPWRRKSTALNIANWVLICTQDRTVEYGLSHLLASWLAKRRWYAYTYIYDLSLITINRTIVEQFRNGRKRALRNYEINKVPRAPTIVCKWLLSFSYSCVVSSDKSILKPTMSQVTQSTGECIYILASHTFMCMHSLKYNICCRTGFNCDNLLIASFYWVRNYWKRKPYL